MGYDTSKPDLVAIWLTGSLELFELHKGKISVDDMIALIVEHFGGRLNDHVLVLTDDSYLYDL